MLYDNAYPSAYDEIKTWHPVWHGGVFEMDALWRVWGMQLDGLQAAIKRLVDNDSIEYADEPTVARLEAFLLISYDSPRTLPERRNVLKATILGANHIGQKEIAEIVAVFALGEISVSLAGGAVSVTVTHDYGDAFNLNDCRYVLERKIPAHLALELIEKMLPVSVRNYESVALKNLAARYAFAEPGGDGAELASVRISGLSARTTNSVTARIKVNDMWTLNGQYALNGGRRLNAAENEEVL